jgi:hypothetical protein
LDVPYGIESDGVLHHLSELGFEISAQKAPKGLNLTRGALPVFFGESIEGEDWDANFTAGSNYDSH